MQVGDLVRNKIIVGVMGDRARIGMVIEVRSFRADNDIAKVVYPDGRNETELTTQLEVVCK